MPYPLAVVVPTYNRCSTLQQCMDHLEQQARKDFEVVIVDDGSTDATEALVGEYLTRTPLAVRYLRQQNCGPARARNLAISTIQAPVTLLIGDDIFPAPQFTAIHLQLHEQRPELSVAGVGLTTWAEEGQKITPLMRWMDRDGMQFNYGELLAGGKPDWRHFYTSNLSVKTELLRRFPFDGSFPHAAMEDAEIGSRIQMEHGLEMVFLRDAVAFHLHPISFPDTCRRMEKVGESTARFHELRPALLPRNPNPLSVRLHRLLDRLPLGTAAVDYVADLSLKVACPNRLMRFVLAYHHDRGYNGYLLHHGRKRPAES